ncbi:DUF4352 domain-containing protein [Olleya sp. R77988]|uniref:DUF4352 domain-containing protein n=1 Tax=Olleya sp. R77988 TaxID=3093875 RepID=UPI0037C89F48
MKNTYILSSIFLFLLVTSCKETYQAISYVDNSKYYEIEDGVFVSISKIGTDVSIEGGSYYFTGVIPQMAGMSKVKAKDGFIYYLVHLKVFNQTKADIKIDMTNFKLQDSNGDLHDVKQILLGSKKPKINGKSTKTRQVAFEYPTDKKLHKLTYKGKAFSIAKM